MLLVSTSIGARTSVLPALRSLTAFFLRTAGRYVSGTTTMRRMSSRPAQLRVRDGRRVRSGSGEGDGSQGGGARGRGTHTLRMYHV